MKNTLNNIVVVAESDPRIAAIVVEVVEAFGYTIIPATAGSDVLAKVIQHDPWLVITEAESLDDTGDPPIYDAKVLTKKLSAQSGISSDISVIILRTPWFQADGVYMRYETVHVDDLYMTRPTSAKDLQDLRWCARKPSSPSQWQSFTRELPRYIQRMRQARVEGKGDRFR